MHSHSLDDVSLAGIINARAVGADPIVGGTAVDHHAAANVN